MFERITECWSGSSQNDYKTNTLNVLESYKKKESNGRRSGDSNKRNEKSM
jgi:hypothetical protein